MAKQESVQVVKDAFAAFGRGDIPGLLALLTEDVEWTIPGAGLPLAGTYRGRDGVANFFQKLAAESEILEFQAREFMGDSDRVFVEGWERLKVKATNRTVELGWIMTFTVRDGAIVNFQQYTDTKVLADAYESSATAAA